MDIIYEWFRELYQTTGINLPFIYDSYDRGRLIDGFLTTVDFFILFRRRF